MLFALLVVAQISGTTPLREALDLGRTHDTARYDAFEAAYQLPPSGDLERGDVVTEFRRAVHLVRQRAMMGEYSYTERDLAAELAPWQGLVTISLTLRLNPLNTFVAPPKYTFYVRTGAQTRPLPPTRFKLEPVFPPGVLSAPGTAMIGVRLEGTFSRADLASAPAPALVVLDDKGDVLWQLPFDIDKYR